MPIRIYRDGKLDDVLMVITLSAMLFGFFMALRDYRETEEAVVLKVELQKRPSKDRKREKKEPIVLIPNWRLKSQKQQTVYNGRIAYRTTGSSIFSGGLYYSLQ